DRVAAELSVADAWPVMTEPFCQWVIEDHFPAGRPRWEKFGATMVQDVTPFEDMKLRLLNGAHSGIAYIGLLSGHETVAAAFADPAIRKFVDGLWADAIATLPQGTELDPQRYIGELADRFANTALAHRTAQIANDGSQKLPQRILASALEQAEAGFSADHLMLVVAAWIAAAKARGGTLPSGHFTDPLDIALAAAFARKQRVRPTVAAVFDLAGFAKGSPHRDRLEEIVAAHLQTLYSKGPAAALAALTDDGVRS
ncbi:MAG TPA: mannitol dehydrogenase family protein, partial [Rhizobiaceae bacterium]|nr:mannitol dehydrogenase family protein [Rhizobiaceae bacterium]